LQATIEVRTGDFAAIQSCDSRSRVDLESGDRSPTRLDDYESATIVDAVPCIPELGGDPREAFVERAEVFSQILDHPGFLTRSRLRHVVTLDFT
jgi:hypothetical protein